MRFFALYHLELGLGMVSEYTESFSAACPVGLETDVNKNNTCVLRAAKMIRHGI